MRPRQVVGIEGIEGIEQGQFGRTFGALGGYQQTHQQAYQQTYQQTYQGAHVLSDDGDLSQSARGERPFHVLGRRAQAVRHVAWPVGPPRQDSANAGVTDSLPPRK